jgi:type IV pilus assembly protein PilY1
VKWIKILFFSILFLFLLFPIVSFAKDTDLYMASGEGVEPNILLIFDNSGSMDDILYYRTYDPATTYDPLVVDAGFRDAVYYYSYSQQRWILWKTSISDVPCSTARSKLSSNGHYEGNTDSRCRSNSQTLRTGNYLNYQTSGGDAMSKLDVAKEIIRDFLDTVQGVKLGVMVFNRSVTDNTSHGGSSHTNSHGGKMMSNIVSLTDAGRTQLKSQITAIEAGTWTPLAETLYEAGLYFKGVASHFNPGVTYVSPIEYTCQRNYIILMTDGDSTRDDGYRPGDQSDSDNILKTVIGDQDGDGREPGGANPAHYIIEGQDMLGTDYLDDVAKYLYDNDLRIDLTGKQNIVTHTIGFFVNSQHQLLSRTAAHGHGNYYYTQTAAQLADAFQNIIGLIQQETSSFVAPIVPVSRMERTTAGDKIYLALFQPNQNKMWSGNIKKFGVVQSGANIGQIIDVHGDPALDEDGQILPSACSYWPTVDQDGDRVEAGGVGGILLNRSSARNLYTYLGSNASLTHSSNQFNTTNITPAMVGVLTEDERNKLVQFVRGFDAYDDEAPPGTDHKRSWILGSIIHSRPFIINYASQTVIFAGSNDGMLHAFDDNNGEELWTFIPPNLLDRLQALHADVNESFVDGSPKAYIARNSDGSINQVILIFGQRRGGNRYSALDVTNPLTPTYLWQINPDAADSPYAEIGVTDLITGRRGQTWSSPNIAKIACQEGASHCVGGEKWVAFIGGGYDDNQDNATPGPDTMGRAVYVVDLLDGSLVRRFSYSDPGYSAMTFSIPSDVARVDLDGDGKIHRLYVGDMGGRMWRFDIFNPNPANWTGRIIFESNPGSDGTTGRKIFYPPDVTLEKGGYEILFFGTGDREHPVEETVINRLYAVKDKNLTGTVLNENNLYDVTTDELQADITETRRNEILSQLNAAYGWLIKLNLNSGEKSLSGPVLFYKTAYFTTFSPIAAGNPCDTAFGTARMYILEYTTGDAVFDLDLSNDIGGIKFRRSDRSEIIGTAIPSGVIITFIQGVGVAYTGVGGGVDMPPLPSRKSLVPLNWRIVF